MRKLLIALALVAATTVYARNPIVEQFLNGSGLILTNVSATFTNNTASVIGLQVFDSVAVGGLYSGRPSQIFYSLTTSNRLPTVVSNATSGFSPGDFYWTNYSTYTSTNPRAGGMIVNTNITKPAAWREVPAWPDADANEGVGVLTVTSQADAATVTNKLTLVFRPVYNGLFGVTKGSDAAASTEGVDKLTIAFDQNGTNYVTVKTNIPDAFMIGAQKLQLYTITTSTNSGAGGRSILYYITASGWSAP